LLALNQKHNSLHLQVPFTQIIVDKIACTVSSLRGIQMLIEAQKHGVGYWLVLESSSYAQRMPAQNISTRRNGPRPRRDPRCTVPRRDRDIEHL